MSKTPVNITGPNPNTECTKDETGVVASETRQRIAYEAPRIETSDIFHTVSNGPVPQYCGGYGG